MEDRVAGIIEEWNNFRPDVDTSALGIVLRVMRAAHHLQLKLDPVAAAYGLSHHGDLDALLELYRADSERGLTPTELGKAALLTAGGMTVRLQRIEKSGLISRNPNPDDGRGVLVRLTQAGIDLIEHALPHMLSAQAASVDGLTQTENDQLADLLRTLLTDLGDVPPFQPPKSVVASSN
ncbi:MarR family winged helix-turn-helix transcriptional regulator [Ilumatobacter sp.]|uniref:MarR family winged helix-turn-helix transcriptional regulator n=1 Tax=Ilumatobacter sp. TaxID=1967498 RepID=UPI003752D80E